MSCAVTVVDYGMGNLLSVQRALQQVGAQVALSSEPDIVRRAERLVLPGVGAFGKGMAQLQERGLGAALQEQAAAGTPVLGICLGAQMLLQSSCEFGCHEGLGILPGEVRAIPDSAVDGQPLKVPHIGWSDLRHDVDHPLLGGVPAGSAVYFVHSYQCHPAASSDRLAHTEYGGRQLTAMVGRGMVAGCQFHPEKSGPTGLRILRNFLDWS